MKISKYMTGPLQVNTYFAYDEETKKGFIVDPGGYDSRITDEAKASEVDVEYIIILVTLSLRFSTLLIIFSLCFQRLLKV